MLTQLWDKIRRTFQTKTDNSLKTSSKTVVGAINEIDALAKGNVSNITDGTETGSLKQNASMVLSKDAIALGSTTSAGTKGFRYTAIDFTTKTITLEKALTASIGAGALLSIINDKHYDKCSKVAETATIGATTIKVKSLPFTSIAEDTGDDAKTIMVYSNPAVGDMDLGDGAHSEGVNTKATQRGSHAEGRDTYAAGQYSHAEGRETEAFYASHAEGRGSKATGDVSHAEGLGTYAIGDHTHAEGQNTHAVGLNAHAEGLRGWANGQHSHAEGVDTVTSNTAEHAEGKFNKSNKADGSFGSAGNTLHSIGIGTSASDRKNAVEVMQNGDVYVKGIGGYDGTNATDTASKTLKDVVEDTKTTVDGLSENITTNKLNIGIISAQYDTNSLCLKFSAPFGNVTLKGIAYPSQDNDAVNKQYVDSKLSAIDGVIKEYSSESNQNTAGEIAVQTIYFGDKGTTVPANG